MTAGDIRIGKQNRLGERVKRRLPIFPEGYPSSIIGAEELNFRVRDGNGCTLFAIVTGSPAHTGGSLDRAYPTTLAKPCQAFFAHLQFVQIVQTTYEDFLVIYP